MIELDPVNRFKGPTTPLTAASRDHERQDPLDGRTLYVLGFGIASAVLVDAMLLVYFVSLYAAS
jgi:hypothetical protein